MTSARDGAPYIGFVYTSASEEAPVTHEIVLVAQQQTLPHCDPADRFLAGTAQVMDLTLITGDELLLGLGTIRTMKNWDGELEVRGAGSLIGAIAPERTELPADRSSDLNSWLKT